MVKLVTSEFHRDMINPILLQIYDSSPPEFKLATGAKILYAWAKGSVLMSNSNSNVIMNILLILKELMVLEL